MVLGVVGVFKVFLDYFMSGDLDGFGVWGVFQVFLDYLFYYQ